MKCISGPRKLRRQEETCEKTHKRFQSIYAKQVSLANKFRPENKYSQKCLNDHLYKTATRLRRPELSPLKQISIQSLLYQTTTCLTRPATTFPFSQMKKKTFLRQPPQNLHTKKMGKKHKAKMHKE